MEKILVDLGAKSYEIFIGENISIRNEELGIRNEKVLVVMQKYIFLRRSS